jgi:hypothetical protein
MRRQRWDEIEPRGIDAEDRKEGEGEKRRKKRSSRTSKTEPDLRWKSSPESVSHELVPDERRPRWMSHPFGSHGL